jgi:hypothetical protein
MATAFPTHRLTEIITVTAIAACALTACGGDTDLVAADPPVFPEGVMGQVTALPTGLIAPGTYPVAGCVQAGGSTTLQRKIRFDADGSVHWLDAANADAVLFTLAPSVTAQEDRSLYYFRPDNWGANLIHFEPGSGDNRAYVQSGPNAVNVFSAAGNLQENCRAAFNPVLRIDSAGIAARLGSAAALNGQGGLVGGPIDLIGVRYTSIGIGVSGAITTQTAEPGSSPFVWGDWLAMVNAPSDNYYEERYLSRNNPGAASGTPANPAVFAYARHPTLQGQQSGSAPGVLTSVGWGIARNVSGTGPAVGFATAD